jgi:hypothetical protein
MSKYPNVSASLNIKTPALFEGSQVMDFDEMLQVQSAVKQ